MQGAIRSIAALVDLSSCLLQAKALLTVKDE